MMTNKSLLFWSTQVLLILILSGLVSWSVQHFSADNTRVVFVRLDKLFNEFQMKKELAPQVDRDLKSRQNILDSMRADLTILETRISGGEQSAIPLYKGMQQVYLEKERSFQEQNNALISQSDASIWTRINKYMEDFGKERDYDVVMGVNGEGSIMYGAPEKDVTEEAVKYINQQYEGK